MAILVTKRAGGWTFTWRNRLSRWPFFGRPWGPDRDIEVYSDGTPGVFDVHSVLSDRHADVPMELFTQETLEAVADEYMAERAPDYTSEQDT